MFEREDLRGEEEETGDSEEESEGENKWCRWEHGVFVSGGEGNEVKKVKGVVINAFLGLISKGVVGSL